MKQTKINHKEVTRSKTLDRGASIENGKVKSEEGGTTGGNHLE
jgi:hypothetical protein